MNSTVRNYLLASKVHWPEREKYLSEVLHGLNDEHQSRRIVDIGCGPGLLVPSIEGLNFEYLGVDSEQPIIDYCKSRFGQNEGLGFLRSDLSRKDDVTFGTGDIVVLNGVVHHLDDRQMRGLIESLQPVGYLILLDHFRPRDNISIRYLIPYVLQYLDKGNFVRNYEYFREIPGFRLESEKLFPIKFMGIKLWDYFCHCYEPIR